jgi:hypothetical protein
MGPRRGSSDGAAVTLIVVICFTAAAGGRVSAEAPATRIPSPTAAAEPTPADVAKRVEARAALPSVHGERPEIEAALVAAGVPEATVARLWHAIDTTTLPAVFSGIDRFLFFTRHPEWLALRAHFAEFLDLPDVTRLTPDVVAAFAEFDGVVRLSGIETLDVPSAQAIGGAAFAEFDEGTWGAAVELPAVRELEPAAAAELARCDALIVLPALRTLSVEAARALARHQGGALVIGGLERLRSDVASALADYGPSRGMLFPDLVDLDSEPLARRLAKQGSVFLPRVKRLTPAIARALRPGDGASLLLPGLTELPENVARELAGTEVTLGCMASLDADAAAVLATHTGPLVFTGTAPLSAAAAAALAKHRGDIHLPHLESLPADVAAALVPHRHTLVLNGLTRLEAPTAARLAEHAGDVALPRLARLDAAAARALAAASGPLRLPGITDLPEDVAAALATHRSEDYDGEIRLDGLTTLTPATAAALAAADAPLWLVGVTRLSVPVAEALARHRHWLMLGVTELPDDVAVALAAHRGGIGLPSLPTASDRAIVALARSEGPLDLSSFTNLSTTAAAALVARGRQTIFLTGLASLDTIACVDVARLLVAAAGNDVVLENVTAIEGPEAVAIAGALATTEGELSLPNLKRISPRALTALLKKEDARLPEIESLEFAPEPGGGTDDFVDPRR